MAVATTRIEPGDCHFHPGTPNARTPIWGHLSARTSITCAQDDAPHPHVVLGSHMSHVVARVAQVGTVVR
jgi:hypothetical protein